MARSWNDKTIKADLMEELAKHLHLVGGSLSADQGGLEET